MLPSAKLRDLRILHSCVQEPSPSPSFSSPSPLFVCLPGMAPRAFFQLLSAVDYQLVTPLSATLTKTRGKVGNASQSQTPAVVSWSRDTDHGTRITNHRSRPPRPRHELPTRHGAICRHLNRQQRPALHGSAKSFHACALRNFGSEQALAPELHSSGKRGGTPARPKPVGSFITNWTAPREAAMSLAGLVSSIFFDPTSQTAQHSKPPLQKEFQQLGKDLQSGNVPGAQQDLSTLRQDLQNAKPHLPAHHQHRLQAGGLDHLLDPLSQALQSGNLASAQQAYKTLQQDFQQFSQLNGLLSPVSAPSGSGSLSVDV